MTTPNTPDIFDDNTPPQPVPTHREYFQRFERPPMSPLAVVALCMGLVLVGYVFSGVVTVIAANNNGLNPLTFQNDLNEKSPLHIRQFLRILLLASQVCLFLLPAFITAWIVYKKKIFNYFRLDISPKIGAILLGLIWLFVSAPMVQYAYKINKWLPLPQFMIDMENSTAKTMEVFLMKDSIWEAVFNFFIIAIVAGFGEELMFRGLLQQQIGRIFKNEHVQVWVAAAIFSAIHLQFQGFLPRLLLGSLLGYLFIWTRSLWVPIIVHLFNNGVQIIALYTLNMKPNEIEKVGQMEKLHWSAALISFILVLGIGYQIRSKYYQSETNV